jgi:hypothetical protein
MMQYAQYPEGYEVWHRDLPHDIAGRTVLGRVYR